MGVERAWYGLGPDVFQNRCVIKASQQNLMFGICTYIHKKEHACNFKKHTKPLSFLPLYSSHRSTQGRYPDLNACTEFRTNQLLARYVARLSGGNGVGGGRRAEGWHRSGKGVGQGRAERGGVQDFARPGRIWAAKSSTRKVHRTKTTMPFSVQQLVTPNESS